ncbi:hypothetical protein [Streptomyces gossypii]|nr:hypothetical protein [Streptomyces gossypii]
MLTLIAYVLLVAVVTALPLGHAAAVPGPDPIRTAARRLTRRTR